MFLLRDLPYDLLRQSLIDLIEILIPLFVSSFRRADELAVAMECRLYHGGEGRTKMKALRYTRLDAMAWFWIILFSLCVILPGRVILL